MSIDRIQYDVTSNADETILQACRDYEAAQHRMDNARREFMREHGAPRGRPGPSMAIATLFFPEGEIPKGWKPRRNPGHDVPKGEVECDPDQRTSEGKRIAKQMKEDRFRVPDVGAVMKAIERGTRGGPHDGSVMAHGRIAWPRLLCLEVPDKRYVLDLPMHPDDDWQPPAGLIELRQSEFWRLIEAHNDRAKAIKQPESV
jgi:hypothetical protein